LVACLEFGWGESLGRAGEGKEEQQKKNATRKAFERCPDQPATMVAADVRRL
jgi:hypothetical protein